MKKTNFYQVSKNLKNFFEFYEKQNHPQENKLCKVKFNNFSKKSEKFARKTKK